MLSLSLLSLLACRLATAAPFVKRTVSAPVLGVDFPDPSIFHDQGAGIWYAFGTQSKYDNTNIHIQLATSSDFNTWTLQQGYDALPNLPGWATDNHETWAPDITQLSDGSFLMYFAASPSQDPTKKCVGTARSPTVRGPYTPDQGEFDCNLGAGGSLDASAFIDSDGTRYVVWKYDGNSLGSGGSCNNGNGAAKTPIVIQQVQADGTTKVGSASQLITNDPADGPDVEAPSMIRNPDGGYLLFFSSNCFSTPLYDVSYAYSGSPTGGFTKSSAPLYVAGDQGLSGPGGMDVTIDGTKSLLHALQSDGRRFLHTATLQYNGNQVIG